MEVETYIIDAFTDAPFKGNPACVCLLSKSLSTDEDYQKIAQEMNLSETAFVVPISKNHKEDDSFDIRWFTPTNEVPLCGHATLASAAALYFECNNESKNLNFKTKSFGTLQVQKEDNGLLSMTFPANPPADKMEFPGLEEILSATLGPYRK